MAETEDGTESPAHEAPPSGPALSRRAALARLGLAAAGAYVAPMVLRVDQSAHARRVVPSPCPPPDGNPFNNPPHCPP